MPKQFASFNTFVSRQTLPVSSCDGLFTDQRRHGGNVHLRDDIAVVCSKHSQTRDLKYRRRSGLRERRAIRKRTARSLSTSHTSALHHCWTPQFSVSVRANHQHPRSPHHAKTAAQLFCVALGFRAQQHIKSALQRAFACSQHSTHTMLCSNACRAFLCVLCVLWLTAHAAA